MTVIYTLSLKKNTSKSIEFLSLPRVARIIEKMVSHIKNSKFHKSVCEMFISGHLIKIKRLNATLYVAFGF